MKVLLNSPLFVYASPFDKLSATQVLTYTVHTPPSQTLLFIGALLGNPVQWKLVFPFQGASTGIV